MSNQEKRFVAVIGSHHKKPKAMFLSGNLHGAWDCRPRFAVTPTLATATQWCQTAGVPSEGVYFIDAENFMGMTEEYYDTEIKLSTFILMCANTNRQVIRYNREALIPQIVPTAEQLTNEALSELARDLAGAPQIITQQADDYAQIVIEKKFIAIHRVPQVGGDACYIWYKDGLKKRYQNEASELPLLFKPSEKESIIQRLKEQGAGECLLVEFTVNMREWLYRKSYNTANVGITTEGDILYKKLLKKVRKLGMTTFSLCQQGELIMHSHDDKGKPIHIGIGELKITLQDGTETVILPDGKRDDDKYYLYVLYTETADGQITYYRSEAPKNTIRIKKQVAEVFTKLQAQAKTVLPDEDGCIWQVGRIPQTMAKDTEIVMQKVQPNIAIIDDGKRDDAKVLAQPKEEQPAAKKRVAYALCDYIDGEPSYFCAEYAELYIKRGKENVQVFCTKEDAEFYNAIFMARHPNQSEMYVVEIEY